MAPSAFRVDLSRSVPTALETFISPRIRRVSNWRVLFPVDLRASKELEPRNDRDGGKVHSMMSEVM